MEHENQKINKVIMQGWTVICTVLFLAYILEVVKHNRTIPYFAIFSALDLVPLLVAWGIYRKNEDSSRIPYLCTVFYGVLYVFVLLTGATPMTFSYILPMLYLLMLTNNPKLIGWTATGTVIANVLSIIIQAMIEHKSVSDYLTDWEIQFAAAVLCAIFSYLAIRVSAFLYEQRIKMIQADEERLKNFFEKVTDVSATVEVDSREMLERLVRLEESSDKTSFAMNEIVSGSTQSAEMVECQLQMTADIQNVIDQTNDVTNNMGNQVAETSEKVSTGIENMRKLFASASDVERNSSQVMEHMNLLQETTEQVEDIISIINGIASQTNLLALNASIEAARAGEAGRGFAVVADEINGLANQTKEATQNIAQMVTTLREKASEAAVSVKKMTEMNQIQNELIGDTDRAFGEIQKGMSFVLKDTERETEQMKNLMAANAQIVESIHTISAVSEEVMANTNQTQTITDENRMVVKQVTELAKMLGQKVAELNSYI